MRRDNKPAFFNDSEIAFKFPRPIFVSICAAEVNIRETSNDHYWTKINFQLIFKIREVENNRFIDNPEWESLRLYHTGNQNSSVISINSNNILFVQTMLNQLKVGTIQLNTTIAKYQLIYLINRPQVSNLIAYLHRKIWSIQARHIYSSIKHHTCYCSSLSQSEIFRKNTDQIVILLVANKHFKGMIFKNKNNCFIQTVYTQLYVAIRLSFPALLTCWMFQLNLV